MVSRLIGRLAAGKSQRAAALRAGRLLIAATIVVWFRRLLVGWLPHTRTKNKKPSGQTDDFGLVSRNLAAKLVVFLD